VAPAASSLRRWWGASAMEATFRVPVGRATVPRACVGLPRAAPGPSTPAACRRRGIGLCSDWTNLRPVIANLSEAVRPVACRSDAMPRRTGRSWLSRLRLVRLAAQDGMGVPEPCHRLGMRNGHEEAASGLATPAWSGIRAG
jgi:hypothetical protein